MQDALLEREERFFLAAQGGFNGRAFAIEPVHIPIEPISLSRPKFCFNMSSCALPSSGFWDFLSPTPIGALLFCFGKTTFQRNRTLDSLNCGAHSGALRPSRISKTDLLQSLNLGPIWQASDSLSPRAPGSARRPFLKFAPEPRILHEPWYSVAHAERVLYRFARMFRQFASDNRSRIAAPVASDRDLDDRCLPRCGFRSGIEHFQ